MRAEMTKDSTLEVYLSLEEDFPFFDKLQPSGTRWDGAGNKIFVNPTHPYQRGNSQEMIKSAGERCYATLDLEKSDIELNVPQGGLNHPFLSHHYFIQGNNFDITPEPHTQELKDLAIILYSPTNSGTIIPSMRDLGLQFVRDERRRLHSIQTHEVAP